MKIPKNLVERLGPAISQFFKGDRKLSAVTKVLEHVFANTPDILERVRLVNQILTTKYGPEVKIEGVVEQEFFRLCGMHIADLKILQAGV